MTDLEALAIRINELTPGLMVSAEMLGHIAQALALDEDAGILFFGLVAEKQVDAEDDKQ
jgi:hypothetical protein